MRWLLPTLALLTGCAHSHGPLPAPVASSVAQSQPAAVRKSWRDNAEYEIANASAVETDPAKKLADLDQWTAGYPETEFIDDRQSMYLVAYQQVKRVREAFDKAQEILRIHPDDFQALGTTLPR